MRKLMVTSLVILLILFSCSYQTRYHNPTPEPVETLAIELEEIETINEVEWYKSEVFRISNLEREKEGVRPFLAGDEKLNRAANIRAREIVRRFEHKRLDGKNINTVFSDVGIGNWKVVAENLASNSARVHSPQDTVDQWLNSEGHRIALLHPDYQYMAVGYAEKNGRAYIVQLFISYFD